MTDDLMVRTDDELRWDFYRAALDAWVDAAGRAPLPRDPADDEPPRTRR